MTQLFTLPIMPVIEQRKDPYPHAGIMQEKPRKGIDSKVQKFARTKITENSGSLFTSATILQYLFSTDTLADQGIDSLPSSFKFNESEVETKPIGFQPCDPDSWINAVMQIVLRLPILKTILTVLAPQSYEPFRVFIDQYHKDQKTHLNISTANGAQIVHCLKKNFPNQLFGPFGPFSLFDIFQNILLSGDSTVPLSHAIKRLRQFYGQFEWDEKESLLSCFIRKLTMAPCDLLISIKRKKNSSNPIPTQIFDPSNNTYYDLHGFIEIRKEYEQPEFITYLKMNGKNWYQCRNQRIVKLCSTHLHLPLTSSHLLHYKKCYV
jgi:hypothetical protein